MDFLQLVSKVPMRAGQAKLEYTGDPGRLPTRQGDVITLPELLSRNWTMYQLQPHWDQFLLSYKKGEGGLWFGGTDEAPFLVRLNERRVGVSREFYKEIVPEVIKNMAMATKQPWVRQGDIFAIPVSSWETVQLASTMRGEGVTGMRRWTNHPLFGTRHTAVGDALVTDHATIFEGLVTAPDHADLALKGPHLVAQTAHLYEPEKAD